MAVVLNILVLVICVSLQGAVKFRCDYPYSNVGWFKYHKVPSTWRDARMRCRFEGAMLASPSSASLKSAMMNAIRNVDVFTGIYAVSPGSYYTIDGIPLGAITHTWAENEPDNKNNAEHCIAMNFEGNFSDMNCDIPRPYICYRPNSLADVNICGTPDPEYHFDTRTNKCYKFHTTPRTFKRAHFVCSAEGGHLAVINSDVESQVLSELFAQYPPSKIIGNFRTDLAYIGFHTYGESADWVTVEGQTLEEAGFSKFFAGEPNNVTEGEYCGSIYRNGLLNDLWCERHFTFICEKKPDYPPVCNTDDFNEENALQHN